MDDRDPSPILKEFDSAVLDALPSHIAVIDAHGTIVGVNSAWRDFGAANGIRDNSYGVGANYFKICRAAVDPIARAAAQGIKEVLSGTRRTFELEYPCHSPDQNRWFLMRVTSPPAFRGFAVLTHENITDRVATEERLRARIAELENRTAAVAVSPSPASTKRFSKLAPKILIVDDNTNLLRAVSRIFTLKGAEVHAFADVTEAAGWLRIGNPDFILTDYHMPGMNGDAFIRYAREKLGRKVPALIMSGEESAPVIQGAKSVGCELILKPFDGESLFSTLLDAAADE